MRQINIRISDEEYQILSLISGKQGIPITSVFRMAIFEGFDDWKISQLLNLYAEGQLRFKEIVNLSGWSYAALLTRFGELNLEPPLIDEAEKQAELIVKNIRPASILKNYQTQQK